MRGKQLQYLAAVSDLAKLDLDAASLTLICKGQTLRASYQGTYAAGYRSAKVSDLSDFALSVSASQFKTFASMFGDDEPLVMRLGKKVLALKSKHLSIELAEIGQLAEPPTHDGKFETAAKMNANILAAEIDIASAFTSSTFSKQQLTGIQLVFSKDLVRINVFDGLSLLYEARISTDTYKAGAVVVPKEDFLLGARLADTDRVTFGPVGSGTVVIRSKNSLFRSSTFASDWQDTSSITADREYATSFQIESAQIRNLTAGAKALDTSPDVNVIGKRGVTFTAESEAGSFEVSCKGEIKTPVRYYRDSLAKLVKLGPILTFHVPAKPSEPTLVEAEHRRCWMVTRI